MLVYLIQNEVNGKRYVGQTRLRIETRWRQHVRDANNGSPTMIARAIRKYGAGLFSIRILAECPSQAALDTAEINYIKEHGSMSPAGYNMTEGGLGGSRGVGPMSGRSHSTETRNKMRAAHLGKPHPHTRDQRGEKNPMYGKPAWNRKHNGK